MPVCPHPAHFNGNLFFSNKATGKHAALGLYDNFFAVAFSHQKPANAAGGVAACFNLAAIRIDDPHKCVRSVRLGRFDHQQLITAYALAPVTDADDLLHTRRIGLLAPIHNDEIIAQTMHLDKRPANLD